jgi:hypothetical protein
MHDARLDAQKVDPGNYEIEQELIHVCMDTHKAQELPTMPSELENLQARFRSSMVS